jgi:hypothetical protein
MAEFLIEGSRGEEVRRLQRNLNAALANQTIMLNGQNILPLETQTGIFGKQTKAAVEQFQRDYKLKIVDGKVGGETRKALAMRVLIISGTVSRNPNLSLGLPQLSLKLPQTSLQLPEPGMVVPPPAAPPPTPAAHKKSWLFQLQPAVGYTPSPFVSTGSGGSSVVAGQLNLGFVYRTASEGPHWEFGCAFQPSFNSQNAPTDPRYTLQLQGSVAYADPYSKGRFHSALFAQVLMVTNLHPASIGAGVQVGGQISVDIIADKWNLYSQAGLQLIGQWNLYGGHAGQLNFGPVFTILGTTIQWDIK